MAASLNYRGRRAGGDPDPNERLNAPPKKGITKPSKKGAKQVQRSSILLPLPTINRVELMLSCARREMFEMSIVVVATAVSGLYAAGESEQGCCESRFRGCELDTAFNSSPHCDCLDYLRVSANREGILRSQPDHVENFAKLNSTKLRESDVSLFSPFLWRSLNFAIRQSRNASSSMQTSQMR